MPNANPLDIAIAGFMNKDLKQCAASTAISACECSNPELRQTYVAIIQDGIRWQERLATIMSQKGWYVAPQADQATIDQLLPQLQAATQGIGATPGQTGTTPTPDVTIPRLV